MKLFCSCNLAQEILFFFLVDFSFSQVLLRVRRLRENGHRLSPEAFYKRKAFFNNDNNGVLTKLSTPPSNDGNPFNTMMNPMFMGMMDPSNLNTMMKRNATMVISNLLLYTWVDSFFSGFFSTLSFLVWICQVLFGN